MKINEIEEIFNILSNTDINEFRWENVNRKISIVKSNVEELQVHENTHSEKHIAEHGKSHVNHETQEIKPIQIKSTMVGTFYRGPVSGNKIYVNKGTKIIKGQVICIIEAMKVVKEIQSEEEGEILEIFVENGHHVEYGQLLFTVLPK